MGNSVLCFMDCSKMLHYVSIFDASVGFNKLQIHNHICCIETGLGNFGHTILFPHSMQSSKQPINSLANSPANSPTSILTNSLITTSQSIKQFFK